MMSKFDHGRNTTEDPDLGEHILSVQESKRAGGSAGDIEMRNQGKEI
jgi:hypothetical protein